jgi:hypothetical protein
MPASYPTSVYSPRTKQNKVGVVYHPEIATTFYAEDITLLDAEVVALETQLESYLDQALKTSSSPTFAGLSVTNYIKFIFASVSTAIGYDAGGDLTNNNSQNTFFGFAAGSKTSGAGPLDGQQNTALGCAALENNTTGSGNTAINIALNSNITGIGNIGIGALALFANEDGNYNVAVGNGALYNNVSGVDNIAIGNETLYNATGYNNTVIGDEAGKNVEAGHDIVLLGDGADVLAATPDISFAVAIGAGSRVGGSYMIALGGTAALGNACKVGIGIDTPAYILDVVGDVNISSGKVYRINGTALSQANIVGLTTASTPTFYGLILNGDGAIVELQHSGVTRWKIQEHSYADNLYIRAYDSAGVEITPIPVQIENPAGGNMTITRPVLFNANVTLGDASTDLITCTGRFIVRTAGSDPQHATPASRPAGSLKEIVSYASKLYFCTNASTPTWEKITSA